MSAVITSSDIQRKVLKDGNGSSLCENTLIT
jgi:hypothetical protein